MGINRHTPTNQGGICPTIRTIAVSKVITFPDVIEGRITEDVEIEGEWEVWEIEEETAHPTENQDRANGRKGYPMRLPFTVAKITYERQRILETLEREPQLIDWTDKNGTRKLIGSKLEGAIVEIVGINPGKIQHDLNAFDLMVQCTRRHRVPFFEPPVPVPPPPPPPPVLLEIGDEYQGGIIAYILQEGDSGYDAEVQHGVIAAPSDLEGFFQFGCSGVAIGTQGGIPIGTGGNNTMFIVASCPTPGTAAVACDELVIGSYDDWFLPSYDELYQFYLNRALIGGFFDDPSEFNTYMSSTEAPNPLATIQVRGYGFSENLAYTLNKTYVEWRVRPARYF